MKRLLLAALLVLACSPIPTFKPAGSVSFTASTSSFGRASADVSFDPMSAPMIVLTSQAAPVCGSPDMVALPSIADAVLVINLYDSGGESGFQPVTPGDYPVSTEQPGRVAVANYFQRCAEDPFNFDAIAGVVHVTRVDPDTKAIEGSYALTFGGSRGFEKETLAGDFGSEHCGDYDSEMSWDTCR